MHSGPQGDNEAVYVMTYRLLWYAPRPINFPRTSQRGRLVSLPRKTMTSSMHSPFMTYSSRFNVAKRPPVSDDCSAFGGSCQVDPPHGIGKTSITMTRPRMTSTYVLLSGSFHVSCQSSCLAWGWFHWRTSLFICIHIFCPCSAIPMPTRGLLSQRSSSWKCHWFVRKPPQAL